MNQINKPLYISSEIVSSSSDARISRAKKEFFNILTEEGYTLVGEYKNTMTKVELMCSNSHLWSVQPNSFKYGTRCAICSNRSSEAAKKSFIELATLNDYIVVGEYKNNSTVIAMKCPSGHDWNVNPSNFRAGTRCSVCSGRSKGIAKQLFNELVEKNGYVLLTEYKNNNTRIDMRCPNGHEWCVFPSNFKIGRRCPRCNKMEKNVTQKDV